MINPNRCERACNRCGKIRLIHAIVCIVAIALQRLYNEKTLIYQRSYI